MSDAKERAAIEARREGLRSSLAGVIGLLVRASGGDPLKSFASTNMWIGGIVDALLPLPE